MARETGKAQPIKDLPNGRFFILELSSLRRNVPLWHSLGVLEDIMDYFELDALLDTLEEGTPEYEEVSAKMDEILDANALALKKMYLEDEEDEDEE